MKFFLKFIFILAVLALGGEAHAATTTKTTTAKQPALEISGWIPYWRSATGTQEALLHIDKFKEINPFGYSVKTDGTLNDTANLREEPWTTLIAVAKKKKIRVIPTIMWSNTEAIHAILKNPKTRKAHVNAIAKMVKDNKFDGVDIDYEAKKADTKKYFSLFLKELDIATGKKWLMCTIEARTPLDSRYDTIPKNIRYANDFSVINKHCDRVRIMAYDQGSIDLKLNRLEPGPYVPVADKRWVEKVMRLTAKTISKKKLVIGVATYGYEYEATPLTEDGYYYDKLWSLNPKYALDLASQLGIAPQRNNAGELSFIYFATTSPVASPSLALLTTDVGLSNSASQNATSTAGRASTTPFHIVWWSDSQAIKNKITLAKKLGLRGVAIFKIDGGADPALWDILK